MNPLTKEDHIAMRFHDLGLSREEMFEEVKTNQEFADWMDKFLSGQCIMIVDRNKDQLRFVPLK